MSSNFYVCIHGHFYQPPRENAWLETINHQESAAPYHDWNERISAECYRPNGFSQILDDQNWVVSLSNNYSRMSFNFGPTLLSWLEVYDPKTYASILEADTKSMEFFGGHGSALAQSYNHIIMPLALRRDKETQIIWGLRDFEKHYQRKAEGMWLSETAVDNETLEILADYGLKFVILAPRQAQAVRPIEGAHVWESVRGEKINPHYPYRINLKDGKFIDAFFYDGTISRAVAFEGLLNNGENFATRIYNSFNVSPRPQLLHIATDGESYGHHHARGDMALAYALHHIEVQKKAKLTNYAQFLELFPPQEEVQIYENSSWSCIHGIERWRSDCGCNSGGHLDWNQKWRKPLRDAMDFLRDSLSPCFETSMQKYTDDPWGMRNDYIHVILDRSPENIRTFLKKWARTEVEVTEKAVSENMLKALEMQRQLMLMYTSCAWFFDEISGLETVQALQYAARAIELSDEICELELETDFLRILESAQSNIPEFQNGKRIYEMFVKPSAVDFSKIATQLVAVSLFREAKEEGAFASFDYRWKEVHRLYSGQAQLIIGHLEVRSRITCESQSRQVVGLHLGDHNINLGTMEFCGEEEFSNITREFIDIFNEGNVSKTLRLIDKYFEGNIYYLNDLLYDQQRIIIQNVFSQTLENLEEQFTRIYHQYYPVMTYFSNSHMALPPVFSHIAHFVQNKHINNELIREPASFDDILRYINEAKNWKINLETEAIEVNYLRAVEKAIKKIEAQEGSEDSLIYFNKILQLKDSLPFPINLEPIQNAFAEWVYKTGEIGKSHTWKREVKIAADSLKIRLEWNGYNA